MDSVYQKCVESIGLSQKLVESIGFSFLNSTSKWLCIDGTSGCFKTTIINKISQTRNIPIFKVQNEIPIMVPNSHPASCLGYIYSGLLSQSESNHSTICDRSFLNTYEWSSFIWRVLGTYNREFGNVDPRELYNCEEFILFKQNIVKNAEKLLKFEPYKNNRSKINCIVIINDDCKKVDAIRMNRGEGSDMDRSEWKFYTYFQNLCYSLLYPNSCINLNDFDTDLNTILDGICRFVNLCLDYLNENNHIKIHQPIKLKKVSFLNDYTSRNLETYNYRAEIRAKANAIINDTTLQSSSSSTNSQIPEKRMKKNE